MAVNFTAGDRFDPPVCYNRDLRHGKSSQIKRYNTAQRRPIICYGIFYFTHEVNAMNLLNLVFIIKLGMYRLIKILVLDTQTFIMFDIQ